MCVACGRLRDGASCGVAVAMLCPVATGLLSRCPSPLALRTFRWGMWQVTWLRSVTEGDTFVAVSWRRCQEGRVLACLCVPWLADGPLEGPCVPRACWACRELQANSSAWFLLCLLLLFARCLALEGLSHSEVVSVAWDPHPREPVEGVLWATSVPELAADLADSGAEVKTRLEVRARLASRGSGWCVLLAASGGGLVAVVVIVFPHDVSKYASSVVPFLGANSWWHRRVWFPDLVACPRSGVVLLVGSRPCGAFYCSFLFLKFLLLWPVRDWYCGSEVLAQTAHKFTGCERDGAIRRVLNATVSYVVFSALPFRGALFDDGGAVAELLWHFSASRWSVWRSFHARRVSGVWVRQ
ncbi:hypothetical protein Taro_020187 [Colocasia esculenta]|uniref:Uncharacterized protein n=1 Tax=Colocasia esculenta TaxID=4460 RepID=A0A843V7S0_COLES|nr:hypothetical protein [Colocasia esculenta]